MVFLKSKIYYYLIEKNNTVSASKEEVIFPQKFEIF